MRLKLSFAFNSNLRRYTMVSGTFGMNLRTGWEGEPGAFRQTVFTTAAVCASLFVAVILYLRSNKLLQM